MEARQPHESNRGPSGADTFQRLFETAPDAVLVVDADGRIVLANARTAHLFGYAPDELLGETIELLVPERFRDAHVAHRTAYVSQPYTRPMGAEGLELVARRKDGTEFPVEISLGPLSTPAGLLVTAIVRDITERRSRDEEERTRSSLNEYATLLRHSMTHRVDVQEGTRSPRQSQ